MKGKRAIFLLVLLATAVSSTALARTRHSVPPVSEWIPPLFKPYFQYLATTWFSSVGVGDFNNDGLKDVVASNDDFSGKINQIHIFLQDTTGGLGVPASYSTGNGGPKTLAVGDLDNDDRDDVVVANEYASTLSVFLQQADGTMAEAMTYTTGYIAYGVDVADLNNDGLTDVVVAHEGTPTIGVFYQQANGTLQSMTTYPSQLGGHDDIETGDVNNDGLADVVKMQGSGKNARYLLVYLQNADGGLDGPIYDVVVSDAFGPVVLYHYPLWTDFSFLPVAARPYDWVGDGR